jgi:Fe-S cluster assembly protein SufD
MNQYINFYKKYRTEIDHGCAAAVNASRDSGFERFLQKGFPKYKSEDYQHIDIESIMKSDFGFYLKPVDAGFNPRQVFHCDVPNLDSSKFFAVNGHFCADDNAKSATNGVFTGDLNEFAVRFPEVFQQHYDRLAAARGSGLSAFNTAFMQGGFVLYVPDGVEMEKPVQLTNIAGGSAVSLVNRRMLIILGRGASAKLLVCDHAYDDKPLSAATQVTEIFAGENSSLDFCELEESSPSTVRIAESFVRQAEGSEVRIHSITLTNGLTRNNIDVDLAAPHATLHLHGIAIADGRQTVDNFTTVSHAAPDCRCDELFRYALDDDATGVFSGRILVAKDSQKTEAFQTNRNLLGSRRCKMFSKPQLEIYADDVKCSHGMTTGQLDEAALFYMRSRGIPADEARLLLKFAFMSDVIQSLRIEGLRDRLKMLIEKRFRGELSTCRGCDCNC